MYEIDVNQARWTRNYCDCKEYPNLCLDTEQFITENTFHNAENHSFSLGRHTLFGILNHKEDTKLGLRKYNIFDLICL